MGKRVVDDASLTALADKMREIDIPPNEKLTFPDGFINGIDQCFTHGHNLGYNEGVTDGYDDGFSMGHQMGVDEGYEVGKTDGVTEGKKSEYDRFWDSYQQNGNLGNYIYAFAGVCWSSDNFRPKYDMHPTSCNTMFHSFNRNNADWEAFDLVERLAECGVVLDTSASTIMSSMFMWAWIGRIGTIDCTSTTTNTLSTMFSHGKIKTIDKLIVKPENAFNNTFQNQAELVNITFEGTIGSAISFQWSTKLSKASIESVIGCLSTITSGLSATFSQTAVNNAFTDEEWATLANTRPNWTIHLV